MNNSKLELGQQVYFAIPYRGLVVTATIVAIDDIYNFEGKAVWHYRYLNEPDRCSTASDEVSEGGWPIHVEFPIEKLKELKKVNQLFWIDEPVGHAVLLGIDVFLSLTEALRMVAYRSGKKKHRRLRQWRNRCHRFVASTHVMNGYPYPNKPKYPDKRIYTPK